MKGTNAAWSFMVLGLSPFISSFISGQSFKENWRWGYGSLEDNVFRIYFLGVRTCRPIYWIHVLNISLLLHYPWLHMHALWMDLGFI
jgi:hypothetical protein